MKGFLWRRSGVLLLYSLLLCGVFPNSCSGQPDLEDPAVQQGEIKRFGTYLSGSDAVTYIYRVLGVGAVAILIISCSWFIFYTVPSWRRPYRATTFVRKGEKLAPRQIEREFDKKRSDDDDLDYFY